MDTTSWPSFLDLFDRNPDKAFADFYRFAVAALNAVPPRAMRTLADEDRKDLIHDVIYHCVRDDFRLLRRYEDRGRPFVAWLYVIAHNKCLDYLRRTGRRPDTVSIHGNSDKNGLENILPDPVTSDQKKIELSDMLRIVASKMKQIGEYCRLLLEMAADELTPKEMVTVLRLPPEKNKKISDDLRYCRQKLKKHLAEAGIDVGALLMG